MKVFRAVIVLNLIIFKTSLTFGFKLPFDLLNSALSSLVPESSRSVSRSGNNTLEQSFPADLNFKDQTKCYGELGCISITDEWFDLINRPLNLLPFDRDKINTRFLFYVLGNASVDAIQVSKNVTVLTSAGFDPEKKTKFVIHGFIDTGFSTWVVKMSQLLAKFGDYNVFAVDWGGGSLPLYTQATANSRVVGLELASFIQFISTEFNYDPGQIHLIGHSLGSHIAGYAGEKIRGLGRITGLDPAEPYFQNMPEVVRLDPSDAKFVDVIHSDGGTILLLGYGMRQPCGHVDFYPNNGLEQPGCAITDIPLNLVHLDDYDEVRKEIFACNHHRAIYYFMESLLPKCQYVGHLCANYDSYLKGQCYSCGDEGSGCAIMGLNADKYDTRNKTLVSFYLSTANAAPFCVHHYRVNLQTAFPPQAASWVSGKLTLSIIGTNSAIQNIDLSPLDNIRIDHGTNLTFLVQNSQELGSLEQVRVDWKYNSNYLDVFSQCWMLICNNKLFVKKIEILDIDNLARGKAESFPVSVCSEEGMKYTGISSGAFSVFERPC